MTQATVIYRSDITHWATAAPHARLNRPSVHGPGFVGLDCFGTIQGTHRVHAISGRPDSMAGASDHFHWSGSVPTKPGRQRDYAVIGRVGDDGVLSVYSHCHDYRQQDAAHSLTPGFWSERVDFDQTGVLGIAIGPRVEMTRGRVSIGWADSKIEVGQKGVSIFVGGRLVLAIDADGVHPVSLGGRDGDADACGSADEPVTLSDGPASLVTVKQQLPRGAARKAVTK